MTKKRYFENPKYNAAFDRFVDVMSRLILKYGPDFIDRWNRILIETDHEDYTVRLIAKNALRV